MDGEQPLGQGNLRALKHGADGHGELALALVAIEQPVAVRLPVDAGDALGGAAMRADRPIGPAGFLEGGARPDFAGEERIFEPHGRTPYLPDAIQRAFLLYIDLDP